MTIEQIMLLASTCQTPRDWSEFRNHISALVAQARDEEAEACAWIVAGWHGRDWPEGFHGMTAAYSAGDCIERVRARIAARKDGMEVVSEKPPFSSVMGISQEDAIRWLDELERNQGGTNGPTIKLRGAIMELIADRKHWSQKWQAERRKYAELRWPGRTGIVRALSNADAPEEQNGGVRAEGGKDGS